MLLRSFHFVASVVPNYFSCVTRVHTTLINSHLLPSTRGLVSLLSRRQLFESRDQIRKFHYGRYNKLYSNHANKNQSSSKGKSTVYYVVALGVLVGGLSYAAVPLYRLFCQSYSYGGSVGHNADNIESMKPNRSRILRIRFNADTSSNLTWKFRPQQTELKVALGETALAFYTATNPTDRPIDGVSTYNVIPFEAGQYFNKIQCFCFEEQRLNPHEQVDMPVFFYIDPDFGEDPRMENIETITLSYTFFEAKEGAHLVLPNAHANAKNG